MSGVSSMTERIRAELERLRADGDAGWLDHAAERSVSLMAAYCGTEELPEGLWRVGVSLALWIYDSAPMDDGADGMRGIRSIREGDAAVTFGETAFEVQRKEREMLEYFSVELDRVRKLAW